MRANQVQPILPSFTKLATRKAGSGALGVSTGHYNRLKVDGPMDTNSEVLSITPPVIDYEPVKANPLSGWGCPTAGPKVGFIAVDGLLLNLAPVGPSPGVSRPWSDG
jgi:hypothetical protein